MISYDFKLNNFYYKRVKRFYPLTEFLYVHCVLWNVTDVLGEISFYFPTYFLIWLIIIQWMILLFFPGWDFQGVWLYSLCVQISSEFDSFGARKQQPYWRFCAYADAGNKVFIFFKSFFEFLKFKPSHNLQKHCFNSCNVSTVLQFLSSVCYWITNTISKKIVDD